MSFTAGASEHTGKRFDADGGSPPQPPGLAEGVGCGFGGLLGFLGVCGSLGSGPEGAGSYSCPASGLGPTSGLRAGRSGGDGSSVTQSCLTLCDSMNRITPGLPVHHQLTESTQTHVHRVSDAIQPSHPLSPPSPPALSPFQHQGHHQGMTAGLPQSGARPLAVYFSWLLPLSVHYFFCHRRCIILGGRSIQEEKTLFAGGECYMRSSLHM